MDEPQWLVCQAFLLGDEAFWVGDERICLMHEAIFLMRQCYWLIDQWNWLMHEPARLGDDLISILREGVWVLDDPFGVARKCFPNTGDKEQLGLSGNLRNW